ncbi:MAG: FkbM family methyltransferase [Opitutaceae bacterium]|jgi:FkbM family methyltransferase
MRGSQDDDLDFFLCRVKGVTHIGANRGQERDLYDSYGLKVLWIEALPDAYNDLSKHLSGHPDQLALEALVLDQDGRQTTFNISSNDGQSSSMFAFGRHQELWDEISMVSTIQLTGITFSTLVSREKIDVSAYNSLVLDTQGSELLVLKGMGTLLGNFRFIKAEAADFDAYTGGCTLTDIDNYLHRRGFARILAVPMMSRQGVGTYYDAVYCSRTVAPLWRLRFAAARSKRLAGRVLRGLVAHRRFAQIVEVLGLIRRFTAVSGRRLLNGHLPGTRSRWSLGPLSWHRPSLILRNLTKPDLLLGQGIWSAPFSYDHTVVYNEVFREKVYELDLVSFEPDLIVDCGAHIGAFTALAATRYPEQPILSFEPDSISYWFLARQPFLNQSRVTLIRAAVGSESNHISFIEGGHWARASQPGEDNSACKMVEVVCLADQIRRLAPVRLLLKIDIEGAELELLPALIPSLPPSTALFFETHGGTNTWIACRDLLKKSGFKVSLLRSRPFASIENAFVDAFALRTG